ncbi:hypothetical protein M0638_20455 [Roseomonas sp. NAR14]|uniref:Uncharacterized protein n=1 Tax=Roseomonas acroporae TaxID=2937791 RepID=A0A9X2BVJ1_9PROT|nr:hypothetical protein [Roseomonas acroporae]MCK8786747.1 hypothetical protein [Roseomonas acroporae]
MSAAVTDVRLRRGAELICRLGPRAVAELLAELGERYGITTEVVDRLGVYARLDPAVLRAAGGDRFPPQVQQVPA